MKRDEQETIVTMMRDEDYATIYTSDTLMMRKLKKYEHWGVDKTYTSDGEIVGVTYKVPKKMITFRSRVVTREMTEEQRQAAAERLRKARENRTED